MRAAIAYIQTRTDTFRRALFFEHLRDRRIPVRERLAFAPAAAPFVMAFADLNNIVLRSLGAADPLDALLDEHAQEDGTHYHLYLEDLATLGYDTKIRFTDALDFLWADEHRAVRKTCYVLTALLAASTARLRLVVVEAIEATGSVAFEAFRELSDELLMTEGVELSYFGRRHQALETGHLMVSPEVQGELLGIALSDEEMTEARRLVDVVFDCFEEMMSEVFSYSTAHEPSARAFPPEGATAPPE
ncbi:MAG: hypothetical protein U0441_26240 [Polyangiaceae bacterium]